MEPVPFCQSLRKEAIQQDRGFPPETAASHLFRIAPHGFPSLRREPGGDGLPIFQNTSSFKAVVSLILSAVLSAFIGVYRRPNSISMHNRPAARVLTISSCADPPSELSRFAVVRIVR
jgi:hypothetical protein